MPSTPIRLQELEQFFQDFADAFAACSGELIAQRYLAPYVALAADGSLQHFARHAEIGAYFQTVLDRYFQQGCRSCRYSALQATALGNNSAVASVRWALLDGSGASVSSWHESYNLTRTGGGLKIFASVDHVE